MEPRAQLIRRLAEPTVEAQVTRATTRRRLWFATGWGMRDRTAVGQQVRAAWRSAVDEVGETLTDDDVATLERDAVFPEWWWPRVEQAADRWLEILREVDRD